MFEVCLAQKLNPKVAPSGRPELSNPPTHLLCEPFPREKWADKFHNPRTTRHLQICFSEVPPKLIGIRVMTGLVRV